MIEQRHLGDRNGRPNVLEAQANGVDAPDSGSGDLTIVGVRLSPTAQQCRSEKAVQAYAGKDLDRAAARSSATSRRGPRTRAGTWAISRPSSGTSSRPTSRPARTCASILASTDRAQHLGVHPARVDPDGVALGQRNLPSRRRSKAALATLHLSVTCPLASEQRHCRVARCGPRQEMGLAVGRCIEQVGVVAQADGTILHSPGTLGRAIAPGRARTGKVHAAEGLSRDAGFQSARVASRAADAASAPASAGAATAARSTGAAIPPREVDPPFQRFPRYRLRLRLRLRHHPSHRRRSHHLRFPPVRPCRRFCHPRFPPGRQRHRFHRRRRRPCPHRPCPRRPTGQLFRCRPSRRARPCPRSRRSRRSPRARSELLQLGPSRIYAALPSSGRDQA